MQIKNRYLDLKTIYKYILLVVITTIIFIMVSSLLPYSEGFKASARSGNPSAIVYVLITVGWVCLAITFIIKHSPWKAPRLSASLIFSLFFVYSFMAQIETYFFRSAFRILTNKDIFLIMISNGVIVFSGVPLGVKLFGKNQRSESVNPAKNLLTFSFPELMIKLSLIGVGYMIIYFVFGYYVAWQVKDLRVFYSGHPEDNGFISVLANNFHRNPVIYPFQWVRGILFGFFVLPLVLMFKERPRVLLISLILVFLSLGISLIIPNFLFPDTVRWAHFAEMGTSMIVFAIIVWFVYEKLDFNVSTKLRPT